jgi:hypothetical protein
MFLESVPDILAEMFAWLEKHMKKKLAASEKLQETAWKFVMGNVKTFFGPAT